MKREETLDYNIKIAWHAISRMYNQYGQEFDVTASTGFVLLNIDVENGTPATKIAPLMGLEARSLTRMLKTMEEKKWIYREKDPTDGRSVRIFLTPLGREKREFSRRAVREFNTRIRERIPSEHIEIFIQVAQTVTEMIEDKTLLDKLAEAFIYETKH
ncbi:MarR family winged helix-turn-helix transcriptional regulator [Marinoscillum furvescens]|uniref:DNA-binding MarR family transcriptional regulator n=1 Tax=Marinoscillum furvescens DSM 4134 TaxID=1122208 RepID=A0A3D9L0A4_MARFU|nr:MarR family transcriptional regulator [Marinoscillum furvescens]RED94129.1 DNA-binding MarR family transcriptional regulator [Marinoscillum furvescens DSM 4134]